MERLELNLPPGANEIPLCLLNGAAHSGAAEENGRRLADIFAGLNRQVRIETPKDCDGLEALAQNAVRRGSSLVIAGGGDGTISSIANILAGSKTALGVLPLGTLNHFAKDLGIPLDLEAAAANALLGKTRSVDVGEVNGRVFINNSSIGLYPKIVRERESLQKKGHGKWVALAQAMVETLQRSHTLRVGINAVGHRLTTRTELLFVGNNEYELAAPNIGARARIDGGELWVCNIPRAGRFRAVLAALRAIFHVGSQPDPLAFSTGEMKLTLRHRSLDVAIDGEVVRMQTPLVYRSRPRALQVIVPAEQAN